MPVVPYIKSTSDGCATASTITKDVGTWMDSIMFIVQIIRSDAKRFNQPECSAASANMVASRPIIVM